MDGDTAIYVNCMPELDAVANPIFEPSEDSSLPVEIFIIIKGIEYLQYGIS